MPLPLILGAAAGAIAGQGMGMLTGSINDQRQLRQQKALNQQQVEAQKDLGRFNQMLSMKTWEETNYSAQRREMEKAGINPGLMYGGTGAGGTTSGGQASNSVAGGNAPAGGGEIGMGMQLGLQAMMMKAQVENTQADTANKIIDAKLKAGGEGTAGVAKEKMQTEIESIAQNTKNAKVQGAIMELQQDITQAERDVKQGTKTNAIQAIKAATRSAIVKAEIDEATQPELIKQINRASQEQALRIEAQQKGLIKQGAETEQINQAIRKVIQETSNLFDMNQREWQKMNQKDQEIAIQQALQKLREQETMFNTSTPQQMKQWTDLFRNMMEMTLEAVPK